MAVITPQTDVYLLKVPLEIDDINQLTFANATAQYNYFYNLPKLPADNFTYQRKDGTIRFPASFDSLLSYNYVMYRNEAYSNKWFYAFITGMEYLNDNVTAIAIKTDTWQTYQFDLTFKPVLIDREHTNDDTVGSNTLPEGLELGEMIANGATSNFGGASDYYIVAEVAQLKNESGTLNYEWVSGQTEVNITPMMNDICRGTTPLVLEYPADLQTLRNAYDIAGLGDAIVSVYMIPRSLVTTLHYINIDVNVGTIHDLSGPYGIPETKTGVFSLTSKSISRPSTLANFTPKNQKLYTYPYCYFTISNNAGSSIPYRYEDFTSSISFNVEGTFGLSGSVKAIPQNYKNLSSGSNSLDYSISGAKFPVCAWKSDAYTNWLTQNAVNLQHDTTKSIVEGVSTAASTGAMLAGLATSTVGMGLPVMAGIGLASAAAGSAPIIGTALEQQRTKTTASFTPDQVRGNMNAGDFLWAKYKSPFTYTPMCIKPEYARCVDEFFSQYGYKTNRVKVPNITGRRNWNYVKTVGCYIDADIPQEDLQEIKSMFDRGITLWHNPATFMDYSQTNDIIS